VDSRIRPLASGRPVERSEAYEDSERSGVQTRGPIPWMGDAAGEAPKVATLKKKVIRKWRIQPPMKGRLEVHVPVINAEARVVKAFGKTEGYVYVIDEPAVDMTSLDTTLHERTLILIEDRRHSFEVEMPTGSKFIGAFFSEAWGVGFMVFALLVEPRRTGAPRVASERE